MIVTIEEAKNYLRVDSQEDDELINTLIHSAEKLCQGVARKNDTSLISENFDEYRLAVLYATGYLYEHREEADHHALTLTLRSMLFTVRKTGF